MLHRTLRLVAAVIALALPMSVPVSAEIFYFEVALRAADQVPPAASNGVGLLIAEYDTETQRLSWTVTYEGLAGAATAAHFHGPAEIGVNAGVLVQLEGPLTSPIAGAAILDPETAASLLAGLVYLNVHTRAFPGGEIRGQLLPPAR